MPVECLDHGAFPYKIRNFARMIAQANPLVHPEQVMFADPHRDSGDRRDDEGIGGEKFTLNIQRSAEDISGYNSEEREDAD